MKKTPSIRLGAFAHLRASSLIPTLLLALSFSALMTPTARAATPIVQTLPATGVSNTVATLNATVNPGGAATTAWFEWGVTANSQRTTNRTIGSGVVASNLTHSLTGLTAGIAYYARVVASNSAGIVRGQEVGFGSPALTLQGVASLTNFLGEPYADAGAVAGSNVLAVAGGFGHSLALRANGTVQGWGGYSVANAPSDLSNVVALSSLYYSAMALRRDGTVFGWGDSTYGQTNIPPDVSNVVAIAVGEFTDAVVRSNGTVSAWGGGTWGNTNVPTDLSNIVSIAAGQLHTVGLRSDGTVVAWGNNALGQTNVPPGLTNIVAIAAGYDHNLALRSDGTVVAWGNNSSGQTNVPVGLNGVIALSGGISNSIALRSDGTVVAWGSGRSTNVPPGLNGVVAIGSGWEHTLVVRSNGTVVAWGESSLGKTNVPATAYQAPAIILSGSVNTNAVGTYVLNYSTTNGFGGVNHVSRTVVIVAPPPPLVTTLPATNIDHVSATINGTVNPNGAVTTAWFQYGLTTNYGTFTATNSFVATNATFAMLNLLTNLPANTVCHFRLVASNSGGTVNGADQTFKTLLNPPQAVTLPASGVSNTIATLNGTVNPKGAAATAWFEWGLAGSGQSTSTRAVGSGVVASNLSQAITGLVPGRTYAGQMVARNNDWLARGQQVRFGSPALALQGAATLTNIVNTPFVDPGIATNSSVVAIGAGGGHCVALRGDGSIVAWGTNNFGQISVPSDLTNAVAISCGSSHSLALRSDGTLVGWGSTFYLERVIPPGLSNVVAISAGSSLNVVLRSDGTVFAWGIGSDGQTNIPPGLSNVVGVAAGQFQSMALRDNGTVAVWGKNDYGQLNVPLDATNVVAIDTGVSHCLALRADGTVATWGYNSNGQGTVPPGLSNVVAISAGNYHNLALRSDGTVIAWGHSAVTNVPAGLSNVVAISAGTFSCMAMSSDGTITLWGSLGPGMEVIPASLFDPLPVAINGSVNSSVPGTYVLTYTRTNLFGGVTTVNRTVVIAALPPTVTVQPVTGVTKTSALLNGTVTLGGVTTRAYFQYGLNTNYGSFSATNILNPPALEVAVSNLISSLSPLTTYHFRLVATNSAGIARSADFAFTTPGSGVAGDLNGDGVVSQTELNTIYANYVTNSPWLFITNMAGMGGTNVSFSLDNSISGGYTVLYSTDLTNWFVLGPATPRYVFTDTNAPSQPQRFYRLRYP